MGKLFTMSDNGTFSQGRAEFSVIAKESKHVNKGSGLDFKLQGEPDEICRMLYTAMESQPAVAKVILTTVFQFMLDKGIQPAALVDHTYFKK
jgi:hypothetical protein